LATLSRSRQLARGSNEIDAHNECSIYIFYASVTSVKLLSTSHCIESHSSNFADKAASRYSQNVQFITTNTGACIAYYEFTLPYGVSLQDNHIHMSGNIYCL